MNWNNFRVLFRIECPIGTGSAYYYTAIFVRFHGIGTIFRPIDGLLLFMIIWICIGVVILLSDFECLTGLFFVFFVIKNHGNSLFIVKLILGAFAIFSHSFIFILSIIVGNLFA